MGGLEGEALLEKIFLLLVFASEAGKNKQQKFYSRGPAAPAGELASSVFTDNRRGRWRATQHAAN